MQINKFLLEKIDSIGYNIIRGKERQLLQNI